MEPERPGEWSDLSGEDGPPSDPQMWTDEQWIAWLVATDAIDDPDDDGVSEDAGGDQAGATGALGRFASGSSGAILGNAMLGMAEAIYGIDAVEIAVVVESDGEPDDEEPFVVTLDPDHPERSTVRFRSSSRQTQQTDGTDEAASASDTEPM